MRDMLAHQGIKSTTGEGPSLRPNALQQNPHRTGEICQIVQFHLRDDTPKQIARRVAERTGIDLNVETARNLRRGRNAPSAETMLALEQTYPAMRAEFDRIRQMAAESDDEKDRALTAAFQLLSKAMGR